MRGFISGSLLAPTRFAPRGGMFNRYDFTPTPVSSTRLTHPAFLSYQLNQLAYVRGVGGVDLTRVPIRRDK
jgi:hypothetical protein